MMLDELFWLSRVLAQRLIFAATSLFFCFYEKVQVGNIFTAFIKLFVKQFFFYHKQPCQSS